MMIGGSFSLWASFGIFNLCIMTYQDLRRGLVNDRFNMVMMGASVALLYVFQQSVWYVLGLAGSVMLLSFLINKFNMLGSGDVSAFNWILYGFGLVNIGSFIWFCVVMLVLYFVYLLLVRLVLRRSFEKVPFYPVILFSFVFVALLYGFY